MTVMFTRHPPLAPVLALLLALCPPPPALADDPVPPAAEYLVRIKNRGVDVTVGAGERSDPEVFAAWRAAAASGRAATPALVEGLTDPSPLARRAAAALLPDAFDDAAVAPLAAALRADADEPVRILCARGLGRLCHPDAFGPLAAALAHDASARVRAAAAAALGDAGGPRAPDPLAAGLADPDPAVRAEVVRSLGFLHAPASLAPLAARLDVEADPAVAAAAVANLARFGLSAGAAALSQVITRGPEPLRAAAAAALADLRAAGPEPEAAAEEEDREGAFPLRPARVAALLEQEIATAGAGFFNRRWLYRAACGPGELPLLLRLRDRLRAEPPGRVAAETGALDATIRGILRRRLAPAPAPAAAAEPWAGATPEDAAAARELLPRLCAAPAAPPDALAAPVRADLARLRALARRNSDLPALVAAYEECLGRFEAAACEELLDAGIDFSSPRGTRSGLDPAGDLPLRFAVEVLPAALRFTRDHPDNLLGLHFLARSYWLPARASGTSVAEALPYLERVAARELEIPMNDRLRACALARLGECYGRLGRAQEAEAKLAAALALRPYQAEAWYALASSRALAGRGHDAIEALARCLAIERVQEASHFALDAQADPTFELLRGRADFKEALRRADALR